MNILDKMMDALRANPPQASAAVLERERIYRAAQHGPVLVQLPDNHDLPPQLPAPIKKKPVPARVELETTFQIAAESIDGGPTASELEEARRLQAKWDAAWRDVNYTYTPDAAKTAFRAYEKTLWAEINLSDKPIADYTVKNEDDFAREFSTKREMSRRQVAEIERVSLKTLAPARARFCASAAKALRQLENTERTESEQFGFVWQPSARVQVLRKMVDFLLAAEKSGQPYRPKSILPFVKI